jgi:DNA-binding CsgD family transcriptional regulator
MEVSVNTVRTHLQRIFDKTGTRRQADLAHLISNHPARVLLSLDGDARPLPEA